MSLSKNVNPSLVLVEPRKTRPFITERLLMRCKESNQTNKQMHGPIWTIIELAEDCMVLNNVTEFHKVLIKSIRLTERTSFQMVNFHKQRAITTENMVRYGLL